MARKSSNVLTTVLAVKNQMSAGINSATNSLKTLQKATQSANNTLNQQQQATNNAAKGANGLKSTFQQLRAELDKMRNSMKKNNDETNSLLKTYMKFKALYFGGEFIFNAGRGIFNGVNSFMNMAWQPVQKSLTAGSERAYLEQLFSVYTGDNNKAANYLGFIDKFAKTSILPSQDLIQYSKAFANYFQDQKEFEEAVKLLERLTILDPVQGAQGAFIAIQEAMSNDLRSLRMRFEFSKKDTDYVKAAKNTFDYIKRINEVTIGRSNLTDEKLTELKQSSFLTGQAVMKNIEFMFQNVGKAAETALRPITQGVLKFLQSEEIIDFGTLLGESLGAGLRSVSYYLQPLLEKLQTIMQPFKEFAQLSRDIREANEWSKHMDPTAQNYVKKQATLMESMMPPKPDIFKAAKEALKAIGEAIQSWYEENKVTIAKIMGSVADLLVKTVEFLAPVWVSIGASIGEGIIKGVGNVIGEKMPFIGKVGDWLGKNREAAENGTSKYFRKSGFMTAEQYEQNAINWQNTPLKSHGTGLTGPTIADAIGAYFEMRDKPKSVFPAPAEIRSPGELFGIRNKVTPYATGIRNVPTDRLAKLHKGETVLSPSQAREYRNGAGQGVGVTITGNTFHVKKDEDIENIAKQLAREIKFAYGNM